MAENPSIREMLADAVGQEDTPTTAASPSTPEPTGGTDGNAPPATTSAAETFSKYETKLLDGHDTTGWTDAQKREWVNAKKAYDKGWHGSNTAYARAKALVDQLEQDGVTVDDVREAMQRRRGGSAPQTPPKATDVAVALKGIDRLIAEATDPDVKEQLRKSKQVLVEETEGLVEARVQTRLKPLEEELGRLKAIFGSARSSEVSAEIDALEDEGTFPASLIEKYRPELIRWGMEYPQVEMEDILFKVVPAKELRAAMTSPSMTSTPVEMSKASTRPSAPRSPTKPATVSGTPTLDEEKFRKPRGGWDLGGIVREAVLKATGSGA